MNFSYNPLTPLNYYFHLINLSPLSFYYKQENLILFSIISSLPRQVHTTSTLSKSIKDHFTQFRAEEGNAFSGPGDLW